MCIQEVYKTYNSEVKNKMRMTKDPSCDINGIDTTSL